MVVAGIVGSNGWLGGCFFFFFPFPHVDLSGRCSGGGWFCSDLLVVMGWVLSIWWWLLGFAGM